MKNNSYFKNRVKKYFLEIKGSACVCPANISVKCFSNITEGFSFSF